MPPSPQEARAALFSAIVLCLLGSFGILFGHAQTSRSADPPGLANYLEIIESRIPAERPAAEKFYRAQWDSDARRPLGWSNVVVSAMLIVGGLMIVGRRKNTLWWIKNSIAANLVQVAGQAYDHFRIIASLDDVPVHVVTHMQASVIVDVTLKVIVYVGALMLVLRKTVRAFLASEGPPRPA